ncbi:uncharacterized protein LOC105839060 isoform X2 [Monomorium pharaonis]|uniref:uncharacterized protein LOC105839060 isoform X2 n=1 Tax=Monomorium pharaonis TaxID=307658 RepID=UPI00063F036F|nr:uncharacterized protein LOC105839060 isoform X2 [Monomorium pharaonis]XP_012540535.1 uncharacterized protein LOC105839060 isoform X2 [Monomorium pharaonis]XP_012540536.1 uncharacterized protein LOC105839060 isoform X2 [Monomorium pharaonis]
MKEINERLDLSSSEDEVFTDNLKQAIDQQFLHDDLYNTEKAKVTQSETAINELVKNKSLRTSLRQEDKFTNFGVTSTFQSYIAKKLGEVLEQKIESKSNETNSCNERKRRRDKNFGIKLLSTSKKLLTIAKEIEQEKLESMECERRIKKNKIAEETEENQALSTFQEIAVDPEYILSKVDTEAWVNKRPEPDFKYKKLKNGTLVEM